LLAGEVLPPGDGHVDILRTYFQSIATAPGSLRSNQLRSAARERLIANISDPGMKFHRDAEDPHGLAWGVVTRFDLATRNIPDRRGVVFLLDRRRLVAFDPAEEARLVRPHIHRIGENGTGFEPDDLLVNKRTQFLPHGLQHCLPA